MAFYIDPVSGHKKSLAHRQPTVNKRQQTIDQLMRSAQLGQSRAQAANLQRKEQIMSILDDVISRAGPGGAAYKAGEAKIEAAKTKGVGTELSRLIGSGLAGTTEFGATERRWEADVGAPARMTLESLMEEKLTSAKMAKAGFLERIEDVGPDVGLLASLMSKV